MKLRITANNERKERAKSVKAEREREKDGGILKVVDEKRKRKKERTGTLLFCAPHKLEPPLDSTPRLVMQQSQEQTQGQKKKGKEKSEGVLWASEKKKKSHLHEGGERAYNASVTMHQSKWSVGSPHNANGFGQKRITLQG